MLVNARKEGLFLCFSVKTPSRSRTLALFSPMLSLALLLAQLETLLLLGLTLLAGIGLTLLGSSLAFLR